MKLKDKRGITELVQNELIKLIIVVIITAMLVYFINSSVSGEASQLISKSREYSLWLDAAFAADSFGKTNLTLPIDVWQGGKFRILLAGDNNELEIKREGVLIGKSYRVVSNLNKELIKKEVEDGLEINVE